MRRRDAPARGEESCLTTRCATSDRVPTGLGVRDDDARAWCAARTRGGTCTCEEKNGLVRAVDFRIGRAKTLSLSSSGREPRKSRDSTSSFGVTWQKAKKKCWHRRYAPRRALPGTLQDALDVDPAPSSPTVLEDVPRPPPDMSDDAAQAQREADAPAVGTVRKVEDAPEGDAERAAPRAKVSAEDLARALGGAAATSAVKTDTFPASVGPDFGVEEVRDPDLRLCSRFSKRASSLFFTRHSCHSRVARPVARLFFSRARTVARDPRGARPSPSPSLEHRTLHD